MVEPGFWLLTAIKNAHVDAALRRIAIRWSGMWKVKSLFKKIKTSTWSGKSLYRGKGMVLHVQLSTNYGLGCLLITKKFLYANSQFYSRLTTAKAYTDLPLRRNFPDSDNTWIVRKRIKKDNKEGEMKRKVKIIFRSETKIIRFSLHIMRNVEDEILFWNVSHAIPLQRVLISSSFSYHKFPKLRHMV